MAVSDGVSPSPKGGPEPARPRSKSAAAYEIGAQTEPERYTGTLETPEAER